MSGVWTLFQLSYGLLEQGLSSKRKTGGRENSFPWPSLQSVPVVDGKTRRQRARANGRISKVKAPRVVGTIRSNMLRVGAYNSVGSQATAAVKPIMKW